MTLRGIRNPLRCPMRGLLILSAVAAACAQGEKKPHIVYLVIDDWGWANFAPHRAKNATGNTEFPTPNLAQLALEGVLLERTYGHKFCGPSRASIQTGRNPIHVTVLDNALPQHNPRDPMGGFQGIPRNMTGVAAKLKGAGYSTHMVGKWHCGLATHDHIPHGRGYDTSLNYMDAANDCKSARNKSCPISALQPLLTARSPPPPAFCDTDWTQQYSSCLDKSGTHPTLTDLWDTTLPAWGQNNSWKCGQGSQGIKNCTWEDDMLQARLLCVLSEAHASPPFTLPHFVTF